ncbi:MAG: glucose-6-phosphate dehydrogenase [Gammaproteobacteria bacterium]
MILTKDQPEHVQLILFGAGGDLSDRLIMPAVYNLFLDGKLPPHFRLLGVGRHDYDRQSLAEHFKQGIKNFSRRGIVDDRHWQEFSGMLDYHRGDLTDTALYHSLSEVLAKQEQAWGGKSEHLFYMAIPPSLFTAVASGLGEAGLARHRDNARLVVEKPLGYDLDSFRDINQTIRHHFRENQIFRIDHFLGKETVQNILALRFANPIFEPIWNRRYVDHVAITVAETLGVEQRGKFYEHAGALRDMIQNHLMQLACLVAMEPPVAYDANDIRAKKLDVLRALRPIDPDDIASVAARGQYGGGWLNGEQKMPYRTESDVDPKSNVETFAALKLYIDNWRWQEVPFYLRTGKRMAADVSEISIRFQDVPHHAFPASVGLNATPARLVIQLQPEQGIVIKFMAKQPGAQLRLSPVDMRFNYADAFQTTLPDAYETLLLDVMQGDATLFMHADQVEAAWKFIMPVLEMWEATPATDFPNYAAGSWGPESAETLIAADGNSWMTPTLPEIKYRN